VPRKDSLGKINKIKNQEKIEGNNNVGKLLIIIKLQKHLIIVIRSVDRS
jgi:hypothetical protein